MRLSSALVVVLAFVVAGIAAMFSARAVVALVEDRSVIAVQEALIDRDHDWASVLGDGLQVIIEGEAPTEAVRFRAMSIAGGIVDASRVIDNMSVAQRDDIAPPEFAIEILRGDSGISVIGLIPAASDRDWLTAEMTRIANGLPVTDLLEVADYPIPDGWRRTLTYAMRALDRLPRSKISVAAERVSITAISDSNEQKRQLETDLSRNVPEGVRLALAISAPRQAITPFTVRFIIDAGGARFDACSADTEAAQRRIIAAAVDAGSQGQIWCPLGLGAPTRDWGHAVAVAIAALAEIGHGTLTFSDADIVLIAAEDTARADFDRIVGELANALPEVFALDATLLTRPEASAEGPPQFTATLSPEGAVQLRGKVPDALMNMTVANYASARFGSDAVTMGTRISEGLPSGWSVRVLAALEALSKLSNGAVVVEPDLLTVRGNTGSAEASAEIARLMIEKLGAGAEFRIEVEYVRALDPIAGLPTPEECVALITTVTTDRKITFDPGSTSLAAETRPVLDDIAEILRRCADLRIEIAGYTDSQGRDEMNLRLSQQRADAVLSALRSRRVPVASFVATGYGEIDPIADNGTEAGREANRRIEFRLIRPETAEQDPTALEDAEAPVDEAVEPDPDQADAVQAEEEGSGD